MQNERHFYGVSGNRGRAQFYRREIARQQAEHEQQPSPTPTKPPMTAEERQRLSVLKDRLKMLVTPDQYLHIMVSEQMSYDAAGIEWLEAEILRIECDDPMREFRTQETGSEFDPILDTDLHTL